MTSRSVGRQQLCRLCAENKDNTDFVGIYEEEGRRLGIEEKITKCLQIQIFIDDCLPLFICLDCCLLLDKSYKFFESTNQAQCSLRQMLIDFKNQDDFEHSQIFSSQPDLEPTYTEKIDQIFTKEEYKDENIKNINDNEHDYNDNSFNSEDKFEVDGSEEIDEGKGLIQVKKDLCKDNKKKGKKKSFDSKVDDFECQDSETDKIDKDDKYEISNVKIPENYMTGTESDMEMIVLSGDKSNSEQLQNDEKRKGQKLERYPWLCTDCNDKLPSLEALEKHHKTIHYQKAKYMCVQCCKVFEKYYGFLTHVTRHKTKAKFSCDDCGKTFVHKKVLDSHKAIHSEERPHVCQTCGKSFRQQSALYIHSRCHLPENMKNKYPCDQCHKRFSTKPNLVTHKRIHSGIRNFTCDQCGKSFIQKGNLEAHFLTHSIDKPYKCSQCSKAFKTPLQLKKHETVHTGAKPHECTVCGRTFREKGTLREHHRIHTGAMPFSCEFCGKCFRFKGILTTHRRQHTGERPYSCIECQHHFTNWPNYNKHMKRRHGINTSQAKQQQQKEVCTNGLVSVTQQPRPTQPQLQLQQQQQRRIRPGGPRPIAPAIPISAATVQVIQTVPNVSVTAQPIVLQTLPTTAVTTIQSFVEANNASCNSEHQQQQQNSTTRLELQQQQIQQSATATTVPTVAGGVNYSTYTLGFLQPNMPYSFYNVSVAEADVNHPR